jgi:putative membrane protein
MPSASAPWATWTVHPSVILGLALLGGLYVYLGGLAAPRRRVAAFAGALLVLLLSLNGPLHDLSDRSLFSAHMLQHLVLTLVFPPLFLYGLTPAVVRPFLGPAWVLRLGAWMTRPIQAGAIFTVPIALWHLPRFYEAAMRDHNLHILQHLLFISTSVIMWWPILSPVPELPRASYPAQLLYLFLLGIPMSVVGAMITLADDPLYPFYVAAPRVFGLTPLADQQIGGLMMWVPGGLVFWLAMTVVWFRWARREHRGEGDRYVPPEVYGTTAR